MASFAPKPLLFGAALALLAAAPPSAGQEAVGGAWELLQRIDSPEPLGLLGDAVAGVGDVDRDGHADYAIGAPRSDHAAPSAGTVSVHSGRDGALLWEFHGSEANEFLGGSVAGAGDVNADGFPDLIVGAEWANPGGRARAGSAYVLSGPDGALLWRFDGDRSESLFGWAVAGAGDVDFDGHGDVAIAAPTRSREFVFEAGAVFVFSGRTGEGLLLFLGQQYRDKLGVSLARAGDVNADGVPDLIAGFYYRTAGNRGGAVVLSGLGGPALHRFEGAARYEQHGYSVDGVGDLNRDGHDDVVVTTPFASPGGKHSAGSVFVYSGHDGSVLFRFDGREESQGEWCEASGAGDVDGDGHPDILVGTPRGSSSVFAFEPSDAWLYSGRDGRLLHRFSPTGQNDRFGAAVAGIGDADGDGLDDLLIGAPLSPGGVQAAGAAFVFGFRPWLRTDRTRISAAAGGSVHLSLEFPSTEAGLHYAVLLSAHGTGPSIVAGIEVPLTEDGLFIQSVIGRYPPGFAGATGILDANATAHAKFEATPAQLQPFIGRAYSAAAITYDPIMGGRLSSAATRLDVDP